MRAQTPGRSIGDLIVKALFLLTLYGIAWAVDAWVRGVIL